MFECVTDTDKDLTCRGRAWRRNKRSKSAVNLATGREGAIIRMTYCCAHIARILFSCYDL